MNPLICCFFCVDDKHERRNGYFLRTRDGSAAILHNDDGPMLHGAAATTEHGNTAVQRLEIWAQRNDRALLPKTCVESTCPSMLRGPALGRCHWEPWAICEKVSPLLLQAGGWLAKDGNLRSSLVAFISFTASRVVIGRSRALQEVTTRHDKGLAEQHVYN